MPAMSDPYFAKSVTYIFEHSQQGAMGLIINRPSHTPLTEIFSQMKLDIKDTQLEDMYACFGGPVQMERGFILHPSQGNWTGTIANQNDIAVTISKDVLEALSQGRGPDKFLVAMGCAGWSAGQLEQEISQNTWLNVEAQAHIIFDLAFQDRLTAAMNLLGIDAASFSEVAGHA